MQESNRSWNKAMMPHVFYTIPCSVLKNNTYLGCILFPEPTELSISYKTTRVDETDSKEEQKSAVAIWQRPRRCQVVQALSRWGGHQPKQTVLALITPAWFLCSAPGPLIKLQEHDATTRPGREGEAKPEEFRKATPPHGARFSLPLTQSTGHAHQHQQQINK